MRKKLSNLEQGDIFYGEVAGQVGSEQTGKRPMVVVSNESFNSNNEFVLVMPLSSKSYDKPDGIPVTTTLGNITGYVLTQHISPFYEEFIKSEIKQVDVVDITDEETLNECSIVFNAIITTTTYSSPTYSQGEIITLTLQGKVITAVVISENSFNSLHNTVWIAPIYEAVSAHSRGDHIELINNSYPNFTGIPYVLCEHVKNIHPQARNVTKTGFSISTKESNLCYTAIRTFI